MTKIKKHIRILSIIFLLTASMILFSQCEVLRVNFGLFKQEQKHEKNMKSKSNAEKKSQKKAVRKIGSETNKIQKPKKKKHKNVYF